MISIEIQLALVAGLIVGCASGIVLTQVLDRLLWRAPLRPKPARPLSRSCNHCACGGCPEEDEG